MSREPRWRGLLYRLYARRLEAEVRRRPDAPARRHHPRREPALGAGAGAGSRGRVPARGGEARRGPGLVRRPRHPRRDPLGVLHREPRAGPRGAARPPLGDREQAQRARRRPARPPAADPGPGRREARPPARLDAGGHPARRAGDGGLRRRRAHVRPGLRRSPGDRGRRPAPRAGPRQAGRDARRDRRRRDPGGDLPVPVRSGPAGSRPDHPDVRRGAPVGLPPVAERVQRVLLLRRPLAGVPQDRFPPRPPELPAAGPALRRVSQRGSAAAERVPRILILSAPYGAGHLRAAEALARALAGEGARVEVLDHFVRFLPPAFVRASLAMFWGILRCAPGLWGLAYEFSARIGPRSPAMAGMDRIGATGLLRHLERERPDAVVHLHPTPAGAMAWLRARGATAVPHGIVFTDFAAHPQWIHAGLERYFVPTEAVRAGVVAHGISPDRVVTSGLPVDSAFMVAAGAAGAPGGARGAGGPSGRARHRRHARAPPGSRGGVRGAGVARPTVHRDRGLRGPPPARRAAPPAARRRREVPDPRPRAGHGARDGGRRPRRLEGGRHDLRRGARARAAAPAAPLPSGPGAGQRGLPGRGGGGAPRAKRAGAPAASGRPPGRARAPRGARRDGAKPAAPGGGADRGQGDARPPGTGMTVRGGWWAAGAGAAAWAAYAWGAQCVAARGRLAARAGGQTPGRAHLRRRARSGGDAPAPAAPGRARRPGHLLSDRRARRAAPGRGARDR